MRKLLIISLLVLSGCAKDNYTVIPSGPGSKNMMQSDLHDCRVSSMKKYYSERDNTGVLLGGILGGAVGGAVGGGIVSGGMASKTPAEIINTNIEICMKKKGYDGTSI